MDRVLYIFVFLSASMANCEKAREVIMDITIEENKVVCLNLFSNLTLTNGERFRLVANVPFEVHYMWCEIANATITSGCIQTNDQCVNETYFDTSHRGDGACSYLMKPNGHVDLTLVKFNGRNYVLGLCQLNIISEDKSWFNGLNFSQATIKKMEDDSGASYTYKYTRGERLNISCETNGDFEVYQLQLKDPFGTLIANYTRKTFSHLADDSLHESSLICSSKSKRDSKIYKLKLSLKSLSPVTAPPTPRNTPRTPTPSGLSSKTSTIPTTSTTAKNKPTKSASTGEKINLEMTMDSDKFPLFDENQMKNLNSRQYKNKFNKNETHTVQCRFNRPQYTLLLYDDSKPVVEGKYDDKEEIISLSHNISLEENHSKTVTCQAKQISSIPRIYNVSLFMEFESSPDIFDTSSEAPLATMETQTTHDTIRDGAVEKSFLEAHWPMVLMACGIVITICVVACCLKVICSKQKAQPSEDYTNLTNDRSISYSTMPVRSQTASSQATLPKMASNYCDPKDTLGRKNDSDPNYSEAREPGSQGLGEGLYAELNRPEDTYAEPYISKTELYARPIPKAQRLKRDDPNYSNVFGQDYVNSKK